MIESMSTRRYHEDEQRLSAKETTSYSKTLEKNYIGLTPKTRFHYRRNSKPKTKRVVKELIS
jgi:hypothetical protein